MFLPIVLDVVFQNRGDKKKLKRITEKNLVRQDDVIRILMSLAGLNTVYEVNM